MTAADQEALTQFRELLKTHRGLFASILWAWRGPDSRNEDYKERVVLPIRNFVERGIVKPLQWYSTELQLKPECLPKGSDENLWTPSEPVGLEAHLTSHALYAAFILGLPIRIDQEDFSPAVYPPHRWRKSPSEETQS